MALIGYYINDCRTGQMRYYITLGSYGTRADENIIFRRALTVLLADRGTANFEYINFQNRDLSRVGLMHLSFKGANFKNADFTQTDLCYSDFTGANLENVVWDSANIYGCIMHDNDRLLAILKGAIF